MVLTCSLLLSLLSIPVGAVNASQSRSLSVNSQIQQVIESYDIAGNLSFAQKQQISTTLHDLAEKMFDINIISIHRIESDGTILYEEKFSDDFSSLFYSWKTNDGTLFVQFIEGDLENIVQFKPDGSIYIDGKKTSVQDVFVTNENITPRAGAITRTQKNDPLNGAAYTGPEHVYNSTKIIDFGANIATLTISAIVAVITNNIGGWLAIVTGIVTSATLQATADWLKSKSPYYNKYASFKDIRKGHPGDVVNYYFKHTVYAYSDRNYGGSSRVVDTYYEIRDAT